MFMRLIPSLAIFASLAIPSVAFAATINLSTGVDVSAGGTDTKYAVVYSGGYTNSSPENGGSAASVVAPNAAWATAVTGTNWIGYGADSANTDPGGYYTYNTSFTLTSLSGLELLGSFSADNDAAVYVNGILVTSNAYSGNSYGVGYQGFSSFNGTADLKTGLNTFQIVVENGSNGTSDTTGPTGLDVSASVTSSVSSTPEPSSLMLLGTGLASVAAFSRRKFFRA
jgi:PEP-CTERM motif